VEIQHQENTLTVDPIMLEEKNCPQTVTDVFSEKRSLNTVILVFEFDVSSVRFSENRYPTFSPSSAPAHP